MIGAITSGPIADLVGRKGVPIFIAEIAPKTLRGALTTLNQAKMGRDTEFEAALRKLRGMKADISEEAAEIQDYIETLERLPKAKMLDLFQRRYIRSVLVSATGLVIGCLIAAVSFYLKVHNMAQEAVPVLAVVGIMVSEFSFDLFFVSTKTKMKGGTFIIYAAINALAIVFVIAIVPETKGKTLEQIQAVVNP
ncbi:hypothetical protein CARUB_v10024574mg [Capsella rubella]|uniref:Uncharacterized protein n=1 Tax=Capsella rubella TaxID=81985 RepID=R0HFE6_9BRAS|nr:hypothetical protein CARUB_v10024574mg [Capsella rubella]